MLLRSKSNDILNSNFKIESIKTRTQRAVACRMSSEDNYSVEAFNRIKFLIV